jgi:predicted transcriptional regulator
MSKKTGLKGTEVQIKTRTLLALWDLGAAKAEVKKGELTKRVQRTNEKAGDYKSVFEQLEKEGAIAIATNNRVVQFSLTAQGLQMLGEGLKSPKFEYDTSVGAKTINALLKWIRQMDGAVSNTLTAAGESAIPQGDGKKAIASYEEFKVAALAVYNQLNRDYNLDDLVPIYRMRREVGDRVSREHFNEWLLEMQANDILQLQGGSLPDSDPAKIEDSITTEVSGLRCYAKRLNS